MRGKIPQIVRIYHITHVSNLRSIIERKGLHSYSSLHDKSVQYKDIAYQSIQQQRATKKVPVPPGGVLHDYVPFYFAPRSPMLYTINRGNVPGYTGQSQIIYLASTVRRIEKLNLPYVFTDGHGIISYTRFFNQPQDLSNVDWGVMKSTFWNDTDDDPDRRRRRQAEFLVHTYLPWGAILFLGTYSESIAERVTGMTQDLEYQPQVGCKPEWYY